MEDENLIMAGASGFAKDTNVLLSNLDISVSLRPQAESTPIVPLVSATKINAGMLSKQNSVNLLKGLSNDNALGLSNVTYEVYKAVYGHTETSLENKTTYYNICSSNLNCNKKVEVNDTWTAAFCSNEMTSAQNHTQQIDRFASLKTANTKILSETPKSSTVYLGVRYGEINETLRRKPSVVQVNKSIAQLTDEPINFEDELVSRLNNEDAELEFTVNFSKNSYGKLENTINRRSIGRLAMSEPSEKHISFSRLSDNTIKKMERLQDMITKSSFNNESLSLHLDTINGFNESRNMTTSFIFNESFIDIPSVEDLKLIFQKFDFFCSRKSNFLQNIKKCTDGLNRITNIELKLDSLLSIDFSKSLKKLMRVY